LLRNAEFFQEDTDLANDHVCGTLTLEGAPRLKKEHYVVFGA
jgi:ribonucleoside-diphosphate reductase alpha chain